MRPDLLTSEEAASWLGWTPEYVRRLARQRRIPAIKLGREWRFLTSRLIAWMEAGCPSAPQQSSLFETPGAIS